MTIIKLSALLNVGATEEPMRSQLIHLAITITWWWGVRLEAANAIRLHDEVVSLLARLFRCLRVDAIVEPIRLFVICRGFRRQETEITSDPIFQS